MSLILVTAPPVEPITLAEAKLHLREADSAQDELISGLIVAVREQVEAITKRALVLQSWDWALDCFPRRFSVPKPPLISVASLKYLDTAGALQTLDAATYVVDASPDGGRVALNYGYVWPLAFPTLNAVTLRFTCGYFGAGSPTDYREAIPASLKLGMKLLLGHMYENREAVSAQPNLAELPLGIRALLSPYVADWA